MTDKQSPDKSGAPPCGLYVRINHDPDMDQWTKTIGALSTGIKHRSGYKKNMHALEITLNDGFSRDAFEKAAAFIPVAHATGLVAIIKGSAEIAKDLGADGVIVNDHNHIKAARDLMGDDAIIGLDCDQTVDNIDQAIAAGVDYITLGQPSKSCSPDLIQQVLRKQPDLICAALGPLNQDTTATYVRAGFSFIDCTHYILAHPKGAMQGVINILHEISVSTDIL